MNQLEAALHDFGQKFEPVLQGQLTDTASFMHPALFHGCLDGGKRIRPFLTSLVGRLYGIPENVLLRAATAVEMVHCYSLVHDDLPAMDNAPVRRGKSSVHVAYGYAQAILVGDGLLSRAFEVLAHEEALSPHVRCKMVSVLSRASGCQGMVAGQWLDISEEKIPTPLAQLEEKHVLKTGEMISCACELGAIAGEVSPGLQDLWRQFGRFVGLAFQIMDDVLDASGNPENMGKHVGQDAHKTTYVSLLGLEGALLFANEKVKHAKMILSEIASLDDENINILHMLAEYTIKRTA